MLYIHFIDLRLFHSTADYWYNSYILGFYPGCSSQLVYTQKIPLQSIFYVYNFFKWFIFIVVSIDLFLISFMPFCTMEYISLVYPMPSSPPPPILTLLSAQTSITDSPLSLTLAFWGQCFSLSLAFKIHDSFHTVAFFL